MIVTSRCRHPGCREIGLRTYRPLSGSSVDMCVAKFTSAGAHLWSKRAGGSYWDIGEGIAVDPSSNVIAIGEFADRVDFGGGALINSGGPFEKDTAIFEFAP